MAPPRLNWRAALLGPGRVSVARIAVLLLFVAVALVGVVGASFADSLVSVPLFDVGRLWVRATADQFQRVLDAVLQRPDLASPWTYVVAVPSLVALYYGYVLLFAPMNRVRLLGSVGYIPDGRTPIKEIMEKVKSQREVGDAPPSYPNGWFCVLESRDLAVKEAKSVNCLGKQLAVFRAEDGRAHVIDAYCPHNGANLAAGGIVKGSCLECPFHGWQFRGDDGKCTYVPYCERKHIPDTARVTSYNVIERNGFIFMWHHVDDIDPTWEPEEIEPITRGEWTYRGRTEHYVNSHIEEVPENGADVAHLSQVHGPIMIAGVDLRYTYSKWWSFARHDWNGAWNQASDPDKKHIGILDLVHRLELFGFNCPVLDLKVQARQIGPGIVNLTFDSLFGSGCFLQVLTPVEPVMQRLIHHVYFQRYTPTVVAKFFMFGEALQVERDLMIWNNKRYVSKPVLVKSKEDALVQRHRRWYSQFYASAKAPPPAPPAIDTSDW
jgi:cholesterol 7-dehydrogenase